MFYSRFSLVCLADKYIGEGEGETDHSVQLCPTIVSCGAEKVNFYLIILSDPSISMVSVKTLIVIWIIEI